MTDARPVNPAEFPTSPHAWAQGASHTPAVVLGDLVILAAHAPVDVDGNVVAGDFETQLRQCYSNLEVTLRSVGCDLTSLVRLDMMCGDIADFDTYLRVREDYLSFPYPASGAFAATMPYSGMHVGLINGLAAVSQPGK